VKTRPHVERGVVIARRYMHTGREGMNRAGSELKIIETRNRKGA
jgi:hypothetical protein